MSNIACDSTVPIVKAFIATKILSQKYNYHTESLVYIHVATGVNV